MIIKKITEQNRELTKYLNKYLFYIYKNNLNDLDRIEICSSVDDKFRCIANIDEELINEEESPFLNSSENHIVSYKYFLPDYLIDESKEIYNILLQLITFDKNIYKGINYDLQKIFINFNIEEIERIIYQASKNKEKNCFDLRDEVINKFALILPQDILLCMKINGFQSNYKEIANIIIDSYNKGEHINLKKFLEKMDNKKNVIYTFSNYLDDIKINDINNRKLGTINKNNIIELKIKSFQFKSEFEKKNRRFF